MQSRFDSNCTLESGARTRCHVNVTLHEIILGQDSGKSSFSVEKHLNSSVVLLDPTNTAIDMDVNHGL